MRESSEKLVNPAKNNCFKIMAKLSRKIQTQKRHKRLRRYLIGNKTRPRLAVYRSNNHIYAQVIDDDPQQTICSASTIDKELKQESDKLFQFGYYLGLAFQIKDDYLEIFGNEESMGKSLGSDLNEDKQTILALVARKNNSKEWANFRPVSYTHLTLPTIYSV